MTESGGISKNAPGELRRQQGAHQRTEKGGVCGPAVVEQADRGILDDITGGYLPVTEQSIEAVQPFTCRVLDEADSRRWPGRIAGAFAGSRRPPGGNRSACCYGLDSAAARVRSSAAKQGRVRILDQDVPYRKQKRTPTLAV